MYVYGSGQPYVCSILEGKGDWPVCHWLTCQCGKQGKRGSAPCHSQRRTKWAEAKADLDTTAWTKACMMRPGWWICIAGGLVHAAVDICLFTKEARMKLLLGCMNKGRNTLNVLHTLTFWFSASIDQFACVYCCVCAHFKTGSRISWSLDIIKLDIKESIQTNEGVHLLIALTA